MDFLLGVYTGVFALVWWEIAIIIGLFIGAIIALFNENGVFGSIVLGILSIALWKMEILQLNVDLWTSIMYIFGYLLVGILWSLFEYKRKAESIAQEYSDSKKSREYIIERIQSRIDNYLISFWVVWFPICVIKFLLGDFVEYLVEKIGIIYKQIAKSVVNKLLPNLPEN